MTKHEARREAYRVVAGLIDEFYAYDEDDREINREVSSIREAMIRSVAAMSDSTPPTETNGVQP